MTPEERDRLARLEQQMADTKDDIGEIKADVKSLVAAFNMGRGRAAATAKYGGLILMAGGSLAWAWDHIFTPLIGKH